jgi:hypothetical protein
MGAKLPRRFRSSGLCTPCSVGKGRALPGGSLTDAASRRLAAIRFRGVGGDSRLPGLGLRWGLGRL